MGLELGLELTDGIGLVLTARETSYDSSLPESDRSATGLGLGLRFQGNLLPF